MNVKEIILGGSGVLVVIMTLVQIAPVKINPWSWLARKFGRAINGEVLEKVDRLEKDVTKMKQDADERAAVACRVRILHFGDETLHGVLHSKDHFDQILTDITEYERYCAAHPNFKNNMTVLTSARIQEIYAERLEKNDFL
ncbi:hypothetical protein NE539_01940 [Flavonifractor plautii]|mgnify:CR=1 FL=1|uniref:hypothetical protein n=1 Tax=Flavonifractor plautii TaxID=292800 RepID=UPI00210E64ED|nr:hypothetical protein [Flavonifractor plautii]MCQ4992060.1 hypothetical protein [Flavonifractor plautii]